MRVVDERQPLDVYMVELVFLEARLSVDAKVRHLIPGVQAHLDTYENIVGVEQKIRRGEIIQQANAKTADVKMEDAFRALYVATLYEVKNNKKDRRFVNLVQMNVSSFSRLNFASQKAECLRMKSALKLTIYEDAFRDSQNAFLDQILLEIEAAVEEQAAVDELRAQQRVEIEDWKKETNRVRMVVYGELITIAEDSNSSWARSFFPAPKARKISLEERAMKTAARTAGSAEKAKERAEHLSEKADNAARVADVEKKKSALEVQKVELEKQAKVDAQLLAAERIVKKAQKDAGVDK